VARRASAAVRVKLPNALSSSKPVIVEHLAWNNPLFASLRLCVTQMSKARPAHPLRFSPFANLLPLLPNSAPASLHPSATHQFRHIVTSPSPFPACTPLLLRHL
jgi:hypothetical protein